MSRIALFFFSLCCFFYGFASSEKAVTYEIKINLADIAFREDGMYCLLANGQEIKISTLIYRDGSYFANFIYKAFGIWECRCGWLNSRSISMCEKCGALNEEEVSLEDNESLFEEKSEDLDLDRD